MRARWEAKRKKAKTELWVRINEAKKQKRKAQRQPREKRQQKLPPLPFRRALNVAESQWAEVMFIASELFGPVPIHSSL